MTTLTLFGFIAYAVLIFCSLKLIIDNKRLEKELTKYKDETIVLNLVYTKKKVLEIISDLEEAIIINERILKTYSTIKDDDVKDFLFLSLERDKGKLSKYKEILRHEKLKEINLNEYY